ncbi:MAG: cysteine synthase A [Desulfohalobium sp.]
MRIAPDMTALVGNTPLVRLNKVTKGCPGTVTAKLETYNPCASVKDRIGVHMLRKAAREGRIGPQTLIVEPTSGNTGIGLAFMCAVQGYRLVLTMPENMSAERRKLLEGWGAEVVLTPAAEGIPGAVAQAERIAAGTTDSFMPQQFANPANPEAHALTTAEEIWRDTEGLVTTFVAGVGSGGTITGVGRVLKQRNPAVHCVGVEPAGSPVLSGGERGPHAIQGIGAGFVPQVLDTRMLDDVVPVSDAEALDMARRLMREEGIACGISSGAIVHAAVEIARRKDSTGTLAVCIICDTAERYLSTELFGS